MNQMADTVGFFLTRVWDGAGWGGWAWGWSGEEPPELGPVEGDWQPLQ